MSSGGLSLISSMTEIGCRLLVHHRHRLFYAAIFAITIGVILSLYVGYNHIPFSFVGYAGVALSALLASGGMVLPIPALAAACTASILLVPLFVAIVAGVAEALGELTGYFLGYSGRGLATRGRFHSRLESWMHRRGWLVLFLLASIPNPLFDVAGIAAGALRFPLKGFMAVVLTGKLIKFMGLAYGCAWGFRGFIEPLL